MSIGHRTTVLTAYSATGSTKIVQIPPSVSAGDLLLVAFSGGISGTPTTPAGWTLSAAGVVNPSTNVGAVYWRIAQPGDAGTNVTFAQTTLTRAILTISAYTGCDQTTPIGATATNSETVSQTVHAGASVVTTHANAWVYRTMFEKDGATASTSIAVSGGPGWTLRASQPGSTFTGANQQASAVADSNSDLATGTQVANWTFDTASANAVGVGLELVPATTSTTVRLISDITVDAGITFAGGATGWGVTADVDPATYIEIPAAGAKVYEGKLGTFSAPPTTVTVGAYEAGSPTTLSRNVKLIQGTTVIADFGTLSAISLTENFTVYTLTGPQRTACTNLSDLRVRITETVT